MADILITGGRVYTADPWHPWAEALLLRDERILYVGGQAEARSLANQGAEQLHLPCSLVLPGINDAHLHLDSGGSSLGMLDLAGVYTMDVLRERLAAYAAANPDREWILGTGLGYEALLHDPNPRLSLDQVVPDRPVYLRAFDWHSVWANTVALERAGILHGADLPLPNEVVLGANGLASGLLKERLAVEPLDACIPAPSEQERDAALLAAMRHLNAMGITSAQNMGALMREGDTALIRRLLRLQGRGEQTVRMLFYMRVREDTPMERLAEFAALQRELTDPWCRIAGIKMFIDGVVESKTAMMLSPYSDGSGEIGVPDMPVEAHRAFAIEADRLGMGVSTHAIGDRAVRCTLDSYQAAVEENNSPRRHRHRVEHIEVLHRDDLRRFAALGVSASMQPLHCAPTIDPNETVYTELLGPERVPGAFVWRSLLESGAQLAFGSDWPVVTPDVFQGLHVAVTRTNIEGLPREGYQPQQRLTLAQALDAYTRGAAHAESQEREKGQLRAGMLADVTILSRDLFALPADAILGTEVLATIVGGRIVHRGTSG